MVLFDEISRYCQARIQEFDGISQERKDVLKKIAGYVQMKLERNEEVQLVFICTHNSRRSHFGQIWAQVAAEYFSLSKVKTYSGGTEATAFHPNAIAALKRIGFQISGDSTVQNPEYSVAFGEGLSTVCFSKTYDHKANPQTAFAAVMTCSDAEENCPFIPGVELRIGTTYDDPKSADGTNQEAETYDSRCVQIAREMLYAFSHVKG